jgi:hypothetical protein
VGLNVSSFDIRKEYTKIPERGFLYICGIVCQYCSSYKGVSMKHRKTLEFLGEKAGDIFLNYIAPFFTFGILFIAWIIFFIPSKKEIEDSAWREYE